MAGVDIIDIFGEVNAKPVKEDKSKSVSVPASEKETRVIADNPVNEGSKDANTTIQDKQPEKKTFDFGFNKVEDEPSANTFAFGKSSDVSDDDLNDLLNTKFDEDLNKADDVTVVPTSEADVAKEIPKSGISSVADDSKSIAMLSGSEKPTEEVQSEDPFSKQIDDLDTLIDETFTQGAAKAKTFSKKVTEKALTLAQNNTILRKFKNGKILKSSGFEFSIVGDEVMLMSYYGLETDLKIPAKVNKIPVRYISPNCFNWNKVRSVKYGFSSDGIMDLTSDKLRDAASGIRSIEFPKTIKRIFDTTFSGCSNLKQITISNEIEHIYPRAFIKCGIRRINVVGGIPKKMFENVDLNGIEVVSIDR